MNEKKAWEILKGKGYKKTDQREKILSIFAQTDRYLSAKDVLNHLSEDSPSLSFDTIYRNLSTFVGHGILDEMDFSGEKQFRMQCETDHHHHHFICLSCGEIKELSICPIPQVKESLKGYEIEQHRFEIFGKCPLCA
ncbi:Fur family transcriptional regulator [Paenisporosarcina cavernae]|uniref:Transcriptional repressor n=1 Tax=Paenisporosarcina cavernae TaxID=2320858 RepID=A0A385YSW7_9BACL|nr:Fur family transcriptional regulator [Paenisporosarcina cavernae]AYC29591.1 transcriptional repressor [Paenisporosarcina cavernae]